MDKDPETSLSADDNPYREWGSDPTLYNSNLRVLFKPTSIAIVGASDKGGTLGFARRILKSNDTFRYHGDLFLINPRQESVQGRKAWKDLASLPYVPDVAVISVSREKVLEVAKDAIKLGVKGLVVNSAGFAERGAAGARLELMLKRLCLDASVPLIGPNCMGIINFSEGFSISSFLLPERLVNGSVAILSQSGGVASLLMDAMGRHGCSFAVSTGNECVTTTEDLIEYAIGDPSTKVIVCYIEMLRRPWRLFDLARAARLAGKPIVILKAGLTSQGREISRGHTGSLASPGEIYRQAFRQAGVILVDDFDELTQVVELLLTVKSLGVSGGIGALGMSGGEIGIVTDLCEDAGLNLPSFSAQTSVRLQQGLKLSEKVEFRNPIDCGAYFDSSNNYCDNIIIIIRALAQDPVIDTIVVVQPIHKDIDDLGVSVNYEVISAVAKEAQDIEKTVIILSTHSGLIDEDILGDIRRAGIPTLRGARAGLRAIRHLKTYCRPFESITVAGKPESLPSCGDESKLSAWSNGIVPQGSLFCKLSSLDMPTTRCGVAKNPEQAKALVCKLGGKAVMKIDTPRVVHKSDVGGVALNVTEDDATEVYERLVTCVSPHIGSEAGEAIFVAEQVDRGVEFYIGAKYDGTFGPVVMLGMGGRLLELLNRTAFLICPFTDEMVRDALDRSGAIEFLSGYRGEQVADLQQLVKLVMKVGEYACSLGNKMESFDLNPVIISSAHPAGVIADARLILAGPL